MEAMRPEIERYLNVCRFQKKLDGKTIKAYHIDLRQFLEYLQETSRPPSKELLTKYIERLNKTYKPDM